MLVVSRMTHTDPPEPNVPSWSTGTDAEIEEALKLHYQGKIDLTEYWAVGDVKIVHLNAMQAANPNSSQTISAQDISVVIVAFNHTDLETPIKGHNKAAITVQTREVIGACTDASDGLTYINGDSSDNITSTTKWSNIYVRSYLNDTVINAFDNTFKKSIKPSKHYRHTNYNGTTTEEVIDKLFLPSYPEIYGTTSSNYYAVTNPVEGEQFNYYKTSTNRIKYGNNNGEPTNTAKNWWNGSISSRYISGANYMWLMVDSDASVSARYGFINGGLSPAWAM